MGLNEALHYYPVALGSSDIGIAVDEMARKAGTTPSVVHGIFRRLEHEALLETAGKGPERPGALPSRGAFSMSWRKNMRTGERRAFGDTGSRGPVTLPHMKRERNSRPMTSPPP